MPAFRYVFILALLYTGLISCAVQPDYRSTPTPPATVSSVDLVRYVGTWYEIARYPNRFEKNCTAVTARYTLRADGIVEVINSCHEGTPDGPVRIANGEARIINPPYNSKLKVRFAPRFIPFAEGDYWIFYLSPDYEVALVGDPQGKYLWILGRKSVLSEEAETRVLAAARKLGFETEPFEYTQH